MRLAILALGGFAAVGSALSLGFGRAPESVTLGQPFDLVVPVRLEPGESVAPACVRAQLAYGDRRIPATSIQVQVERGGDASAETWVRIRSPVVIDEPAVAVDLTLGCSGSVARQFTVLADPPMHPPAIAAGVVAEASTVLPTAPATAAPPANRQVPASAAPAFVQGQRAAAARRPTRQARAGPPQKRGSVAGASAVTVALGATAPPARHATPTRAATVASTATTTAAPRLKLEEPDELLKAAKLAVAAHDADLAQASAAASAAQAAESAAEQRVIALEQNLRTMQDGVMQQRAAVDQLHLRLAQAEEQDRTLRALSGLVLALGAVTLWLGMRLRALQRERKAWWVGAGAAEAGIAPQAAAPASPDGAQAAGAAAPDLAAPAAAGSEAAASANLAHADVLPPQAWAEQSLTRPVNVDELIDLEQQAEFFLVLGEEESAIDLLMTHLRSSGGISPLPYLKLLEIYRRRGDREAYERTRKRFNDRFNAVAPDWDVDLDLGRELQDYAQVVAALQASWPQPLDAMAELESLLFRKRSDELFDLPAYRDVLTLYAVARDLHRRGEQDSSDVDLLLPMAHGFDGSVTAPQSIFDRSGYGRDLQPVGAEDRPTAPIGLDLDLDEPAPAEKPKPVVVSLRRAG